MSGSSKYRELATGLRDYRTGSNLWRSGKLISEIERLQKQAGSHSLDLKSEFAAVLFIAVAASEVEARVREKGGAAPQAEVHRMVDFEGRYISVLELFIGCAESSAGEPKARIEASVVALNMELREVLLEIPRALGSSGSLHGINEIEGILKEIKPKLGDAARTTLRSYQAQI